MKNYFNDYEESRAEKQKEIDKLNTLNDELNKGKQEIK